MLEMAVELSLSTSIYRLVGVLSQRFQQRFGSESLLGHKYVVDHAFQEDPALVHIPSRAYLTHCRFHEAFVHVQSQ